MTKHEQFLRRVFSDETLDRAVAMLLTAADNRERGGRSGAGQRELAHSLQAIRERDADARLDPYGLTITAMGTGPMKAGHRLLELLADGDDKGAATHAAMIEPAPMPEDSPRNRRLIIQRVQLGGWPNRSRAQAEALALKDGLIR